MVRVIKFQNIAGIFANMTECFVGALLVFSLPFLASDIYMNATKDQEVVNNLFLIGLSLWSYPLGGFLFGKFGDRFGRRTALITIFFIMKMALLIFIVCPKKADTTGYWILGAMSLFHFGSGAQINGGAIFSLEHSPPSSHGKMSGLICFFSVFGILMASLSVSLFVHLKYSCWNLMWIGLVCLLAAFLMMIFTHESPAYEQESAHMSPKTHIKPLLVCFCIAALFGVGYYVPFVFLVQFIPTISTLSQENILFATNVALVIYMVALLASGIISDRLGLRKTMRLGSVAMIGLAPLALWFAMNHNALGFGVGQCLLAMTAGIFIGPSHALMLHLFPPQLRYQSVGATYTLAITIVGGNTPSLLLWAYSHTQSIVPFCAWVLVWTMLAWVLLSKPKGLATHERYNGA
jgi:MHS family proline/betaine transporter-like MFS transporter